MSASSGINTAQLIFTLVFAISFISIVGSAKGLLLLDLAAMKCGSGKAWARFLIFLVWLFLFPAVYYWLVMSQLAAVKDSDTTTNLGYLLIILLQGLAGFAFFEIMFGSLLLKWGETYAYYDHAENPLQQKIAAHPEGYDRPFNHIGPAIIWLEVTILLLLILGYVLK